MNISSLHPPRHQGWMSVLSSSSKWTGEWRNACEAASLCCRCAGWSSPAVATVTKRREERWSLGRRSPLCSADHGPMAGFTSTWQPEKRDYYSFIITSKPAQTTNTAGLIPHFWSVYRAVLTVEARDWIPKEINSRYERKGRIRSIIPKSNMTQITV